MGKIALELHSALQQKALNGASGRLSGRTIAEGVGWSVSDMLCTSGPLDRPYEEQHSEFHIAIVLAGSFQCRSSKKRELMIPGSFLLANSAQPFQCSHEHGTGDRCLSFAYSPVWFEQLAADVGLIRAKPNLRALRLPPLRPLSSFIAQAEAGLLGATVPWEELSLALAAQAIQLSNGFTASAKTPLSAMDKIARAIRVIEHEPEKTLTLHTLAQHVCLSPYHFLRTFQRVTGLTPHQYILRARLLKAATCLLQDRRKIVDIALDCGFGDISNFNHAFRREFGLSPLRYRQQQGQKKNGRPV